MAPRHVPDHGMTTKSTDHAIETPARPENITWVDWDSGEPQLGAKVQEVSGLGLGQIQQINVALAKVHKSYFEIEQEHTERKENAEGHQVVTVKPFSKELTRLEDEFWTEVDAAVTDNYVRGMLRERLPVRGEIFPFGAFQQSVEFWKVGAWYHYKYENSSPQRGPELPRNLKHLWQPKTPATEGTRKQR
jgi:hypothetical protein